uniref:Serine/arginine repetitive matrix 4 n=1 Tax=Seriola lalandi dorsalis TaxID=1841481 RepID=A0A3B4XUH8_SERLL
MIGELNLVSGVQLGEKQLFEKFWKGTFKAVATPRPESVIVASITARRRVKCPLCSVSVCSPSFDEELSPRPKGKKKKRKSERKRKRKRSVPKMRRLCGEVYYWAPLSSSLFVCLQMLSSKPGSELLPGKGSQHLSRQTDGPHDYDSGNDTSSPPSSKTGVSRASVTDNKRSHCQRLASPEKLKFADRDNASDSGNSVTSYASLCKPYGEDSLSATLFSITLGCRVEVVRPPKTSSRSQRMSASSRRRLKTRASSSRSRSRSSGSSRYSGRYSRSPSMSSYRWVRHLYVVAAREHVYIYIFTLLCVLPRLRDRKRTSSSRETDVKHAHKVSGKRRRRKSYSPMKKRRRDSPSHLEARRITSARKRPIPYFRPSPSSSSRSTSVSSWSSLFTRSRSRSPIHSVSRSRSRSRSRSHSYSSYRSYSRSSSWNSIFGTRSRSRSRGSLHKRNKTRH